MVKLHTAPYAVFLLRVTLGVLFLAHVSLKLFVFTPSGFVGYFASLGLPAVLAWAVMVFEIVGGLALVFGVYATWFAIPLALEILGTILLVHGKNGWLFMNKGGGWEFPALWLVALIALYLLGDGAFAVRSTRARAGTA
ncbi:MAG: DoxX family protein [Proteobacteria bacterium]|nr:DoxX family protein [Pseudomonadota bacterium]